MVTLADLVALERELEAFEAEVAEIHPLTEEELDGVRISHGGVVRAVRLG